MSKQIPFEGDNPVANQPASDPAPQRPTPKIEVPPVAHRPEWIRALLIHTNQYCDADRRDQTIRGVYDATGGSDIGHALAEEWYRRREDFPGSDRLAAIWRGFSLSDANVDGFAVLCRGVLADGFDPLDICESCEPQFEEFDGEAVEPMPQAPIEPAAADLSEDRPDADPMAKLPAEQVTTESENQVTPELILTAFSLTGSLKKLKRELIEQKRLLDGIALIAQAGAWYGAPNVGKTLLMLWLLIRAIQRGWVDPSHVFYINCDDSMNGLVDKLSLAEAYGFHMLADGHRGFEARNFIQILHEITVQDRARGVVIVLDTLKKFTDLMDKRVSAGFGRVIRRFVMRGGTVILLSHVNKKPGPDGRPIYSGTSDIVEDVDCAYTLRVISEPGAREKVVEFENIKRRGDVVQRAVYAYSTVGGLSYEQLLASVRQVNDTEAAEIQVTTEARADAERIAAVQACIRAGIATRMKLIAAIAQRTGCGRRGAQELLDQYTGVDVLRHHWTYDVQARGAKVYRLLEPAPEAGASEKPATDSTEGASHE